MPKNLNDYRVFPGRFSACEMLEIIQTEKDLGGLWQGPAGPLELGIWNRIETRPLRGLGQLASGDDGMNYRVFRVVGRKLKLVEIPEGSRLRLHT